MVTVKFNSLLRKAAGVPEYEHGRKRQGGLKGGPEPFGQVSTATLGTCVITVNGRNVNDLKGHRTKLQDGDEVSLFPPIAGG